MNINFEIPELVSFSDIPIQSFAIHTLYFCGGFYLKNTENTLIYFPKGDSPKTMDSEAFDFQGKIWRLIPQKDISITIKLGNDVK